MTETTTVALTIHITAPNARDAATWAQTIADHITAEFGDSMRLRIEQQHRPHVYLSTGCLHGQHDYCQGKTGQAGAKTPAKCKFCDARCICDCHTDKQEPIAATTKEAPK